MQWAEKMNGVWQLRPGHHRIFYFWHAQAGRYVLLNGFRKKSNKTPRKELTKAETLRAEHLDT
jgi:phage-related protein